MKNFDSMFAQAVSSLLKEQKKDKAGTDKKSAGQMILWNPGRGRWSDVIKGVKAEANMPYEEAAKASLAVKNSSSLMSKLLISKPSTSDDATEAAAQILNQAFKNQTMSEVYETPTGQRGNVIIGFKLPTDKESINEDGMKARNAAAYIHLTLIGAYNAGMLKIDNPIKLSTPQDGDDSVKITYA